jgi:hypothetical protein
MRVLAPAGVEVDPELPVLAAAVVAGVDVDMYEMVSVAEEHQQRLLHEQGGCVPPACEVVKPERYRVQSPCVRLCIVDTVT